MHLTKVSSLLVTSAVVSEAFSPQTFVPVRGPVGALSPSSASSSFCNTRTPLSTCNFNNHGISSSLRPPTSSSSYSQSRLYVTSVEDGNDLFDRIASIATNDRAKFQLVTLLRVGIPSIVFGIAAFFVFPFLALFLASIVNDAGVFAVLSQDSSQFVQNFLTVSGLLFSILIGQTFAFLYTQQEAVFYALFNEVTEAKSLLEQVALVCQGRSMYGRVLESISKYVQNDLKQLKADPAVLISARPVDDPLESIMYLTSVGVPSSVYETVRSLRQARAARLGALQRKLPRVHFILLWILAVIELVSFPLLGAGTQTIGGYNILTVEGVLFGVMTFGIVMTMKVISELNRPGGGAYNVDGVLSVMIKGLEIELKERLAGGRKQVANESPSLPNDVYVTSGMDMLDDSSTSSSLPTLTSGGSIHAGKDLMRKAVQPLMTAKKRFSRNKQ